MPSDSALSLIRTVDDARLVIAQARGLRRAGRNAETDAMYETLIIELARAVEDPESAAIGELVGQIAENQGANESDVYLKLVEWAGLIEAEHEAGE